MQAFLGDRTLTTAELGAELGDVSPASLYRHIARLVEAGVLQVVDQRRVRGTVERTYRLHLAATHITDEQLAAMSAEDHRRAFLAYIAGVLGDFDRYLDRGDIDLRRDGVGYRTAGFWLDDNEFRDMIADVSRALAPYLAKTPAPGRRLHYRHTINLPGNDHPI